MEKIQILIQMLILFSAARLFGRLLTKIGIPSVAGELLAGAIVGPQMLHIIEPSTTLETLAEIGVIVLLFNAGLETHIDELLKVGKPAVLTAVLGVIFPFVGGYFVGQLFGYPTAENLFIGTTFVATSVGITIRVLQEFGYAKRTSAKIILAAAILDDILGLLVLAIVKNVALGKTNVLELVLLAIQAVSFVLFLSTIGPRITRKRSTFFSALSCDFLFELSLILMLGLAILAEEIGLAAIVGSFLAGLVLSEIREFTTIEDRYRTIGWFFTPFFFGLLGTHLDFSALKNLNTLVEVLIFTVIAVVGKLIGGYLGSIKKGKQTALEVGVGMIPRGEVGIVVAGLAFSYKVVASDVYLSLIATVLLSTVISPFLIKWIYSLKKG
ncbi:MAG: cation:proton antiporter [Actinobacteria bacterium]|nr:cation:proton antiporter [Actinomycetota bacterium]